MGHDDKAERSARNEDTFRRMNERLHDLAAIESTSALLESYVCECFQPGCAQVVELTAAEYASVRAVDTHFLTVPDVLHMDSRVEDTVEQHDRYWVVAKRGEAGEVAAELAADSSV